MLKLRSLLARLGAALPMPFYWIWTEPDGDVRIVCRPGRPGSGYRWSVTVLSARRCGRASAFEAAQQAARAVAEAVTSRARHADEVERIAEILRQRGDDELALRLYLTAQDLRGNEAVHPDE